MCLALPAQIVALEPDGESAVVALGGVRKRISLALIEEPQVGEFVLVHVGYALHKISAEEAERTLALMAEIGLDAEADAERQMEVAP
ncbi:HypC/HybG/HupF family hydrogenase formation chaperone [Dongia sp.]|uniref:HypC/HybG/HupF family hydrogenase formation chaperone n=1 Tax=Dongia sp. TaxID=1977262 RepID=UPI0035B3EE3C